ncbi:hypothetical protein [Paenibacillus sp. NEAU-GSW1]|uniref:hypothetical protein n=1 Tax=Paenibacillus sp. NEAU-GSW1 TaxID=2682486 RepID=UPI0012E1DEAB|nr:hypothetical protein [Paenibacillus sp. NEAU-GSW1]MUT66049.1 hypothetical protein [Paenibacillus sp. NEAU-GSW1]
METKRQIVLRHKSGLYFGRDTELTKKLWSAWRWYPEQFEVWIEASIYAPKNKDEFDPIEVELVIREVEQNE